MLNKYFQYLPWLILGAIGSYQSATYYARTAFDVFYLTTIFLIVYIALLFLHENYLKYRYKDFFTHLLSNSKKDSPPIKAVTTQNHLMMVHKEVGNFVPTSFFISIDRFFLVSF